MGLGVIYEGARWARVTVEKVYDQTRELDLGGGITSEETGKAFLLLCDCGKRVEVFQKDFKGKRNMPDCGSCGLAAKEQSKSRMYSVLMPHVLIEGLRKVSREKGVSVNRLIIDGSRAIVEDYERGKSNGTKTRKKALSVQKNKTR